MLRGLASPIVLISDDPTDLLDDVDLFGNGSLSLLSVPFARTEDDEWLVTVDVALTEFKDHSPAPEFLRFDYHAFGYEITLVGGDSAEQSSMDRNITKHWLPADAGQHVLDVVTASCRRLLLEVNPGYLFRVTNDSSPVASAFPKHNLVTNLMNDEGYSTLIKGTDAYDRSYWLMGRLGFDLSYVLIDDAT